VTPELGQQFWGALDASGSDWEVPGGGEFSTMEKRRDECLRHSLARVAFDFFTPSYASGSVWRVRLNSACDGGAVDADEEKNALR